MAYHICEQPAIQTITSERAKEMLKFNTFPGQRTMLHRKVEEYKAMMQAGTFRPSDVSFARSRLGATYLVNGQHTLSAVAMCDIPLVATVITYACDTDDDLWKLFASFDQQQNRSVRQCVAAARGLLHEHQLRQFSVSDLAKAATALFAIELGGGAIPYFYGAPVKKVDRIDMLNRHSRDVLCCMRYADSHPMMRVGVLASIVCTVRTARYHADALTFWDAVASGANLEVDDVRINLHKWLLLTAGNGQSQRSAFQRVQFATAVSFWNSWVQGKPRDRVSVNNMTALPAPVWRENADKDIF